MGIVSFLSCLYFFITILLMFKRNTYGNTYIGYGVLTFLFVTGYSSIPNMPTQVQSLSIFLIFSLMIMLFGVTFGILMTIFNKSNKVSKISSVISSTLLIILLFNTKGYLTYMYVPVLIWVVQDYINNMMKNTKSIENKSFIFNSQAKRP